MHSETIMMQFHSYACEINFVIVTVSSLYSYDQKNTYSFEIQIEKVKALIKENATLAIDLPNKYLSLLEEKV